MADRARDETVEDRVVEGVAVVGRHPEDGGGHHDLVVHRAVVGVDRVGAHAPLLAFRGAADPGERPGARPPADVDEVLGEAVGADLHALVAAPLVGIADAQLDRGELAQGPRLRVGVHPLRLADAGGEGGPHVLADEAEPFALRRGEAARHVFLAEQVAQGAVLDLQGALLQAALLLRAGQDDAFELEGGGRGGGVQHGSVTGDRPETEVVADLLRRGRGQDPRHGLEEVRLADDDAGDQWGAGAARDGLPTQAGREGVDLRPGHRVVMRVGVAQLHHRQGGFGELGLEREDRRAGPPRPLRVMTEEAQHLGDMGGEGFPHAPGGGLVAEIERALREGEPRLPELQGDLGLVLLVLPGEHPEERPRTLGVEIGGRLQERLRRLGLLEFGQDGAQTGRELGRAGLEAEGGTPEIGEPTLIGGGVRLREQLAVDRQEILLDEVVLPGEGIVDGPVRGQGKAAQPDSVGVHPEVLPRGHRRVAVGLDQVRPSQGQGQQGDEQG